VKTETLDADKAVSTNKNCTYEQTTHVSSSSQDQLTSSSVPSSGVVNSNSSGNNALKSISPMSMSSNENITISMGGPPTTNGYMNTYFQSLTKLKPQNKSIMHSQIQKPKTVLLTNNANINNINNDMSTVVGENQISPQGALGSLASLTSSSSSFLVKKPSQQPAPPSAQLMNKSNISNSSSSSIQSYLNQSNNGKTINEMKSNSSVCLTSSSSSPSSSSPSSTTKPINSLNSSAGGLAQHLVGALPVNGSNQYQENQVTTTIKNLAAPKLFQSVGYSQQTPSSSSTSSSSALSNNNSNMVNNNNNNNSINSNYSQLKLATSTSPTQVSDSNIVSSTSSSTGNDLNKSK
jgi:hypothetical protein